MLHQASTTEVRGHFFVKACFWCVTAKCRVVSSGLSHSLQLDAACLPSFELNSCDLHLHSKQCASFTLRLHLCPAPSPPHPKKTIGLQMTDTDTDTEDSLSYTHTHTITHPFTCWSAVSSGKVPRQRLDVPDIWVGSGFHAFDRHLLLRIFSPYMKC